MLRSLVGSEMCIRDRSDIGESGGTWEFPGGKLEKNERAVDALTREIQEAVSYTHLTLPTIYSV